MSANMERQFWNELDAVCRAVGHVWAGPPFDSPGSAVHTCDRCGAVKTTVRTDGKTVAVTYRYPDPQGD